MFARALTFLALIFLAVAPIEAAHGKKNKPKTEKAKFPTIFIHTVHNQTPYDLEMVDRLAKNTSLKIPSGQKVDVALTSNGLNKVVLQGTLSEAMASKAQYVFIKLNAQGEREKDQEVYLNISFAPGGVSDGMFTVGTKGSVIMQYYVSGKTGRCLMHSRPLANAHCKTVEFDLNVSMDEADITDGIFRLTIDSNGREVL